MELEILQEALGDSNITFSASLKTIKQVKAM